MFRSRTTDPEDPCFVGRLSDKARKPQPHQRPSGAEESAVPRMFRGSTAHRIYVLLSMQGATRTKDIAAALDILLPHVWQACKRYVDANAIKVTKVVGTRHELYYSVGTTPVVEV